MTGPPLQPHGHRGALAIAADVLEGRSGAGEAVETACARIATLNGTLNAFVDFDPEVTASQVIALERRLASGEKPALAGVPVAIKDHIMVAGWRYTEGSRLFADRHAADDDPVVARLRIAGAILVGRTNMSEFGCKGVTSNALYGPTRHPVDPTLTPGGSSGGAAVAVAAGMVPLALASDGGGSVRRPAAHVGVVGAKPSTGMIADPRDFSHTSVFGVIAGNVADAAAMLSAIAGPCAADPVALPAAAFAGGEFRRPRVAWAPTLGLDVAVDDDIAEDVAGAVARLGAAGWHVERADPIWPVGADEEALMPLQHAALAAAYGARWRSDPELFDADIGRQIVAGLALSGAHVAQAQALSLSIARTAATFFARGFDALLCPTVPCAPWPHVQLDPILIGGRAAMLRGHAVFTPFFNHAFCPAVSLPVPRAPGRLPAGLQIAGPRLSDASILRLAAGAEAILQAPA